MGTDIIVISVRRLLKRQWPLIGFGILLALVCSYLIKSGKEVVRDTFFEEITPGEGIKLKDIHYAQDNPDKGVIWNLHAREMRSSGDKNSIFFNDFRLRVEPEGRPFFELKGKKGDYSRDSGEINLWGDLEVLSGNGFRFTTADVLINEKSGQLSTDKPVEIFGPFFSMKGRGLFVDLEKETLKILSEVTTILNKESLI
jgi:LPS export ABC transporter protein LptC